MLADTMGTRADARRRTREILRKGHKLVAILREPAYRPALRRGVAAAIEHEPVPFRHEFRSIVDVGAGRGQFALVARHRFPNAQLHCFEPLAQARRKLTAVLRHDDRVQVYDLALGSADSRGQLRVTSNLDSSSLLPMTGLHVAAFPGTGERGRVTVSVARLDELLSGGALLSPSLLKIDVQGYELEVLAGSEQLLPEFASVFVECSFVELYSGQPSADDVIRFLHDRGFRLAGVYSVVHDETGECVQADMLFDRGQSSGSGSSSV